MTDDLIFIQTAPSIPELKFRHYRGVQDLPLLVEVISSCAAVDHTERTLTVEEMILYYAANEHYDPDKDLLIAEIDGKIVGCSRIRWNCEENNGPYLYMFPLYVIPSWRGKGLEQTLLEWVEERSREIAVNHPSDRLKLCECYVTQYETGLISLLEKSGFFIERYFNEMVRPSLEDIPNFPMPEGLEVRPVLPEHYRLIWDAFHEAFRDHWSYLPETEEDFRNWQNDPMVFQPHLWQVAWDIASNQVAGQVLTFIDHPQNALLNRKRGYTERISVRRPWRRRGLARALIVRSLLAQKEAGMIESALGVDTENLSGAVKIYEDCGFRRVKTNTIYRKAF